MTLKSYTGTRLHVAHTVPVLGALDREEGHRLWQYVETVGVLSSFYWRCRGIVAKFAA